MEAALGHFAKGGGGPLRGLPWLPTLTLASMFMLAASARADDRAGTETFFENRVRPVLAGVCLRCHGPEKQRGGLRLDTRDALLKGGKSGPVIDSEDREESLILEAIRREDGVSAMPPDRPLPEHQVADLAAWVKAGAPWPKQTGRIQAAAHWAFQPVRAPALPAVQDRRWLQTSVDAFILARLEQAGRRPAQPADRSALLRRLTYDLTGLPPTYDELTAFERDGSPGAIEAVVDRLLASPGYGEHWGRHWLDVVRYADTAGETSDVPVPLAWRYRNYVIDALNADKPYDEFLREQIAGDILAQQGPRENYAERVTATGYLAVSRRFGFDSENYHHLTIQDTIDTLGQSVLGLSLGCARCHDHKFDPISMRDYYAVYGIFDSSRYAFPGSEQKQQVRAMVPLVPPRESMRQWRRFDARVDSLACTLEAASQPVPKAILRSLHDDDGDFELQAVAAGGSNGVLVQPWLYVGTIAVTSDAQSPFKNLYARGKVGVSVARDAGPFRIWQAIYPERSRRSGRFVYANLDFRVTSRSGGSNKSHHRFWMGAEPDSPAFEVLISGEAVSLRSGQTIERIGDVRLSEWSNLRLVLDLNDKVISGEVGAPDHKAEFSGKPFSPGWPGRIDLVVFDSGGGRAADRAPGTSLPAIQFDNFGIQDWPIPAASPSPEKAPQAPASGAGQRKGPVPADAKLAAAELKALLSSGPFPMTYGMAEGTPHDVAMQLRGEPEQPGAVVPRGLINTLGGGPLPPETRGSGRLELARWLTRSDNPLAARVMVNRIWQYHFGRGLVKTPNDFGVRGLPPTHPELLDHLAAKFIESGWSTKAIHRLIVLSATYQQSSPGASDETGPSGAAADDYAFFARRRLSAEEIRDSILATSGQLDRRPARGHPFPSPTGWGFTQHAPFSAVYDHDKRSVYLMTQRIKRHPFLALFDGADPNASTGERQTTTVPTQALFFLNDPFVHAKAARLAARLQADHPGDPEQVERAWRGVLGRSPTPTERGEGFQFLRDYRAALAALKQHHTDAIALAAYIRTLFGSNEFIYLD